MELIYTTLLLHKAGKTIDEANIKKVLNSIGIQKSDGEIKGLIAALEEVNIEKAIHEAAIVPTATEPKIIEEKKEEKEEEIREDPEKAAAGLASLFG